MHIGPTTRAGRVFFVAVVAVILLVSVGCTTFDPAKERMTTVGSATTAERVIVPQAHRLPEAVRADIAALRASMIDRHGPPETLDFRVSPDGRSVIAFATTEIGGPRLDGGVSYWPDWRDATAVRMISPAGGPTPNRLGDRIRFLSTRHVALTRVSTATTRLVTLVEPEFPAIACPDPLHGRFRVCAGGDFARITDDGRVFTGQLGVDDAVEGGVAMADVSPVRAVAWMYDGDLLVVETAGPDGGLIVTDPSEPRPTSPMLPYIFGGGEPLTFGPDRVFAQEPRRGSWFALGITPDGVAEPIRGSALGYWIPRDPSPDGRYAVIVPDGRLDVQGYITVQRRMTTTLNAYRGAGLPGLPEGSIRGWLVW